MTATRRGFLAGALAGGASVAFACAGRSTLAALAVRPLGADATFLGNLAFVGERDRMERTYGRGHEGRRRLDLRTLTEDALVVSNERFYVRTRYPDRIDPRRPWRVPITGRVDGGAEFALDDLERRARPLGVHLLECSGNGGAFGLISAAEWSGVPLGELLTGVPMRGDAARVLVRGFDEHSSSPPGSSQNGASWIFTWDELAETGAFLATGMNGEPLPKDHGFPVRLVVPGWYGCACIKWVDGIELVGDDAASTRHMREFARRTHQRGTPRRARDYRPAEMDLAAMVVRVEKWREAGKIVHRAVGILWGGKELTDRLTVQLGRRAPFVPVESYRHETNRTWTLWTHTWRPARTGDYTVRLAVDDPAIRTRRLDSGFYARTVRVDAT